MTQTIVVVLGVLWHYSRHYDFHHDPLHAQGNPITTHAQLATCGTAGLPKLLRVLHLTAWVANNGLSSCRLPCQQTGIMQLGLYAPRGIAPGPWPGFMVASPTSRVVLVITHNPSHTTLCILRHQGLNSHVVRCGNMLGYKGVALNALHFKNKVPQSQPIPHRPPKRYHIMHTVSAWGARVCLVDVQPRLLGLAPCVG